MSGFSSMLLSVFMSIIMMVNGLPLNGLLNNSANLDKEALARERAQQFAEYLDAEMQMGFDGPIYGVYDEFNGSGLYESLEDIPEGSEYVELDLSSINNFFAYCEAATKDPSILGGDFYGLDFKALEGKQLEEDNALDLIYDIIQFVADNDEAVSELMLTTFDYGKLEMLEPYVFGEEGVLGSFNLYEIAMQMLGAYGENVTIDTDDNGTMILVRGYKEDPYNCEHPDAGYCCDWTNGDYVYNPETGNDEWVEYRWHYIPLTDAEKAEYSADGFFVDLFSTFLQEAAMSLGIDEVTAKEFAMGMDISKDSVYALIPAILDEIKNLGTDANGDIIMHEIRQFFISIYGVRNIKASFAEDDVRTTGVRPDGDDVDEYAELKDYYLNNYTEGDYALFDYDLTVDGIAYKMFEASYKDDGTLVFYPYEENIGDKEIQSVINGLFDMHFGTLAEDVIVNEEDYGETIVAEDGNTYYIGYDGYAYKLFDNFYPTSREATEAEIASLTDEDIIADKDIVVVGDNSILHLYNAKAVYNKDGYYYYNGLNDKGEEIWKCLAEEQNDPFYTELNSSLANLCSAVNPYFVYNANDFSYVAEAEELGYGLLSQVNNVIAIIIGNSMTETAKAEIGWVEGSNDNLNDNILSFIRFAAEKLLTEGMTQELYNMSKVFEDNASDMFDGLSKFFELSYYTDESLTLEKIALDAIVGTFVDANNGVLFNDLVLPENINTLESFFAYVIAYCGGEIVEGVDFIRGMVQDGRLVDKTDEEWIDVILDTCMELLLRIGAKEADSQTIVFTTAEIDAYVTQGWGHEEFLDELFDRFYVYLEGFVEVCDGLDCKLGVLDGNGPWYKISKYLNALLPVAVFNNCEKTYGFEKLEFDLGVFVKEAMLGNGLDMNISAVLDVAAVNESGANPFFENCGTKALLVIVQNFVNAILPGTILDENIQSIDQLISEENIAAMAVQLINSVNNRKEKLVPLIFAWLEALGAFEGMPFVDYVNLLVYELRGDENGSYANIIGYFGDEDRVVLPTEIGEYPVKGFDITYNCEGKTIVFSDTIQYMNVRNRDWSWSNYAEMNYEVPETNPWFDEYDGVLFSEGLTELLVYPDNKEDEMFTVPGTVEYLSAYKFRNNTYLRTLKLENGVRYIRTNDTNSAWDGFNGALKEIYIPASVEGISVDVFRNRYDFLTIYGASESYAYEFYRTHKDNYPFYGNVEFVPYFSDTPYVTLKTEAYAVKSNIYCYGYANEDARIYIYDGDQLIGNNEKIKGNKYSKWEANVPLYNPVDTGSDHVITAVIYDDEGNKIVSRPITVHYEKNAVVFLDFQMVHSNYYKLNVTPETINRVHTLTWIPYSDRNDTYRVKFLNSNKLADLYLVSTTADGQISKIRLDYAGKDTWIGSGSFNQYTPGVLTFEGVFKKGLETRTIGGAIKITYLVDPSGNVYEFTEDNPLEGVTATVYYKDEDGNAVEWDAEYYSQINPIVTGKDGFFQWDVPKGEWKVIFEKEGYETLESDWMPVPPEVTGLKCFMEPTADLKVTEAYYKDGVTTVYFNKYLTTTEIYGSEITASDLTLSCTPVDAVYGTTNAGVYAENYFYETAEGTNCIEIYSDAYPGEITMGNLVFTPTDLTETYCFGVTASQSEYYIGDTFTLTLAEMYGKDLEGIADVKVSVENEHLLDSDIPETVAFDEDGNAVVELVAGMPGYVTVTFDVAGNRLVHCFEIKVAEVTHVCEYGDYEVVAPTCTKPGYQMGTCSVCGDVSYYYDYNLKAHDYQELATEEALKSAASCTAKAIYYKSCAECGELSEEFFAYGDVLDHEPDEPYKDNISADGNSYDLVTKCKYCMYIFSREEIREECKHTDCATIPAKEATCTVNGNTEGKICNDCGETVVEAETIPAGHKEEILPAVSATCAKTGLTEGKKCTVCGETTVEQEVTPATGKHSYGDWTVEKAPTCTEKGKDYRECATCNGKEYRDTNATGHKETVLAAVSATCEKTGLTEGNKCTVCGTVTKAQETVAATGHDGKLVGQKDATKTEEGYTGDTVCRKCGKTLSTGEKIPVLPADHCDCNCHKTGFNGFIWKILRFFYKLFKVNPVCDCGAAHY